MRITKGEMPDEIVVDMDSHDEFASIKAEGAARTEYLVALYEAMVGRLMPIKIKIMVPLPRALMLDGAREIAEKMQVEDGKLIVFGTVSHPEMNGYPLDRSMLPALARAGREREVARRLT